MKGFTEEDFISKKIYGEKDQDVEMSYVDKRTPIRPNWADLALWFIVMWFIFGIVAVWFRW